MNALKTTQYIIDILSKNGDLTNLIPATSILPLNAIEGVDFPFIAIVRNSIHSNYCKDGLYNDEVSISIIVVDKTYKGTIEAAEIIRDILDYTAWVMDDKTSIQRITFAAAYEGLYNNAYIQQLDFTVKIDAKLSE